MMERNITVDEYKGILEKVKAAALQDMSTVGTDDKSVSGNPEFSLFGLEARFRDREYFEHEHYYEDYDLCTNFHDLREMIFTGSEEIGLDVDFKEPMEDVLYWRVRKFTGFLGRMMPIYDAYFDVYGELFSVEADRHFSCYFEQHEDIVRREISVSPELEYILRAWRQLSLAWNVELPYRPGCVLYVDVKPFKAPFYAVYCAENDSCFECDWDWSPRNEYGYTARTHPILYTLEQGGKADVGHLWQCKGYSHLDEDFYEYTYDGCTGQTLPPRVVFPHTPYERITPAETCEDSTLRRVSGMLKANLDAFTSMYFI